MLLVQLAKGPGGGFVNVNEYGIERLGFPEFVAVPVDSLPKKTFLGLGPLSPAVFESGADRRMTTHWEFDDEKC